MNMNPDQFSQQYSPGNPYIPSDPYALRVGFGKRLGAAAIDFVIVGIIGGIVGSVIGAALFATFSANMSSDTQGMDEAMVGIMAMIFGYVLAWSFVAIVYSFIELFTGASPAKHILGIVAAHEDRSRGDIALYAKRWIIKQSPSIVSILSDVIELAGQPHGSRFFCGLFLRSGREKTGSARYDRQNCGISQGRCRGSRQCSNGSNYIKLMVKARRFGLRTSAAPLHRAHELFRLIPPSCAYFHAAFTIHTPSSRQRKPDEKQRRMCDR
jgi:uncharacterized RDD family membrane protein YckC